MPEDEEMTKFLKIVSSEGVNGGKRQSFAAQQPTRGRPGVDQDPRALIGRLRRAIGWFKTTASGVRRWGC